NELARTVKRHVAAAIGFKQLNSLGRKKIARGYDVLASGIAPQGNDRRMLQQQQRVAGAPFFYQMDQGLLQAESGGVIHASEINHVDDAEHVFIVWLRPTFQYQGPSTGCLSKPRFW